MGVAQNSLQGLVGTVAAGAIAASGAVKGQKEQKQAATEELDFAKAELAQAEAASAESKQALEGGKKTVDEAQKVYDDAMGKRYGGKGNTKAKIQAAQQQALDDLTAAQRAFEVLGKKDTAAKAVEARWRARVTNARKTLDRFGGRK